MVKNDFNDSHVATRDQLERLIKMLQEFANENATDLSFDNFATLNEMAEKAELYIRCLQSDNWQMVIDKLLGDGHALLRFLQEANSKCKAEVTDLTLRT
ncbi:MAG: hypothetical protein AAGA30_00180 [Planctomycetota bacterium]